MMPLLKKSSKSGNLENHATYFQTDFRYSIGGVEEVIWKKLRRQYKLFVDFNISSQIRKKEERKESGHDT